MVKLFVGDGDQPNYLPVFITVSAIMIFAVLMLLITIREKKLNRIKAEDLAEKKNGKVSSISNESSLNDSNEDTGMPKEVRKSFIFILLSIVLWFMAYNAVTTAFSRYSMEVWDREVSGFADSLLIALVAASISFIPIGILSSKFGRKKMIIAGIIIMTCSYMCGVFIKEYSVLVNVIFAFTGIGWAAINVNSYPMVVEMSKGSNIGKYTGYYYTFSMLAQIITPILSGALLEISYRTLFPYAVFFSFASLCTMLFVKHGDSIPAKRKDLLENYDVND
jgi:MFS family permease